MKLPSPRSPKKKGRSCVVTSTTVVVRKTSARIDTSLSIVDRAKCSNKKSCRYHHPVVRSSKEEGMAFAMCGALLTNGAKRSKFMTPLMSWT